MRFEEKKDQGLGKERAKRQSVVVFLWGSPQHAVQASDHEIFIFMLKDASKSCAFDLR